jgi:hypothetical protein
MLFSVVGPNSFFSDSNPQIFFGLGFGYGFGSYRYGTTNILSRNFLKWCLSLLLYRYALWNLYDRGKSFPAVQYDLRFFTKFLILQQCLDPNPNPNFFRIWPKLTDSSGFEFTTLTLLYQRLIV